MAQINMYKFWQFLFQGKYKKICNQLYTRRTNAKNIYVQILNKSKENTQYQRSQNIVRELAKQNYVCIIISIDPLNIIPKFEEITENVFITSSVSIIFNLKDAIVSINSDVTLYSLQELKQIKSNNNKIIYKYIAQDRDDDSKIESLKSTFKSLINESIVDFAVCTTTLSTEALQYYLPVDKVLYSPDPEEGNSNDWRERAESLVRCIDFLVPVPSNLKPLPERLYSVDDKLLDVQAEIARSIVHPNNLYYRHCEKLYFQPILDWFDKNTQRKKVLDIGCAYGTLSLLLSKHFSCDVYTIDFMEDYYPANLFKKNDIKFKCANLEVDNIPYDEKFDLVILTEVLEHFNFYPTPSLKKIAAQMSDDGILIITTPDASQWGRTTKYYNSLAEIPYPKIQDSYIDDHVWQYNKDELAKVVTDAGFEILELEYAPGMPSVGRHFCLKLKKL